MSTVNRRHFLALTAALAAGELRKPARTIFLSPAGGWPDFRVTSEIANAARVPIEWINPTISPAEQVAADEYFARVSDARIYIDG